MCYHAAQVKHFTFNLDRKINAMNQQEAFKVLKQLIAKDDGRHKLLIAATQLVPPLSGQTNRTYHPQHSANELSSSIHAKLRALQEHLETGKITNSPLVDNVVKTFSPVGTLSVDSPQLYQLVWAAEEIEGKVKESQGELIALIDQRIRKNQWPGGDYVIERIIRLGYLTGTPCGESTLPTDWHAAFNSIGWDNGEFYVFCAGDIELAPPTDGTGEPPLAGLNVPLEGAIEAVDINYEGDPERPVHYREILIGGEEIEGWFTLRGKRDVLVHLTRQLEAKAEEQAAA